MPRTNQCHPLTPSPQQGPVSLQGPTGLSLMVPSFQTTSSTLRQLSIFPLDYCRSLPVLSEMECRVAVVSNASACQPGLGLQAFLNPLLWGTSGFLAYHFLSPNTRSRTAQVPVRPMPETEAGRSHHAGDFWLPSPSRCPHLLHVGKHACTAGLECAVSGRSDCRELAAATSRPFQ